MRGPLQSTVAGLIILLVAQALLLGDVLAQTVEGTGGGAVPSLTGCPSPPPGMACVPGASFSAGLDGDEHVCEQPGNSERPTTTPAHAVTVDTFFIDLTEVTNEAFRACVEAGGCPDEGPNYLDFDAPQQPVTGISWFAARAFCVAQGKRLPTEAEWELAARGPEGELNPFGNEPVTCENAVIRDESGRACGVLREGSTPRTGRVHEVRSRPAGRYGLFDMVGNAEEWVADWWTPDYAACGEACAGSNPRGPCAGADDCDGGRFRVVRGGSWYWRVEHATGYHRRRHFPSNDPYHHFGFRCAADP